MLERLGFFKLLGGGKMSTEYEQALKVGNGSNLVILIKFKDSGRGEIKTVKFSHFGAPNVSNLVILIKFKGSGRG